MAVSPQRTMNIFQVVGVLVIVDLLIWAIWARSHGLEFGWSTISILTIGIVAGLALVWYNREVTVSFGKEGASIKAAAERVQADAASIAAIRARVEAQAATMDLVARDSAEAKSLLQKLRDENARAEEKLKLIEDKTSQIVQLPDGRLRTGGSVSGSPTIIEQHFNAMVAARNAQKLDTAYAEAIECARIYDETQEKLKGVVMIAGGDLTAEARETIYAIAAECSLKAGRNEDAVSWHEKALKANPTAARTAIHVMVLLQAGQKAKAEKLIEDTLKRNDTFSASFKTELAKQGVVLQTPAAGQIGQSKTD